MSGEVVEIGFEILYDIGVSNFIDKLDLSDYIPAFLKSLIDSNSNIFVSKKNKLHYY